jgi:hypothetical protein
MSCSLLVYFTYCQLWVVVVLKRGLRRLHHEAGNEVGQNRTLRGQVMLPLENQLEAHLSRRAVRQHGLQRCNYALLVCHAARDLSDLARRFFLTCSFIEST